MLNSYTLAAKKRTLKSRRFCSSTGDSVLGESDIGSAEENKPEYRAVGEELRGGIIGGYVVPEVGRFWKIGCSPIRFKSGVSTLGRFKAVDCIELRPVAVFGRRGVGFEGVVLFEYER